MIDLKFAGCGCREVEVEISKDISQDIKVVCGAYVIRAREIFQQVGDDVEVQS